VNNYLTFAKPVFLHLHVIYVKRWVAALTGLLLALASRRADLGHSYMSTIPFASARSPNSRRRCRW
jgi:hypothetical protein